MYKNFLAIIQFIKDVSQDNRIPTQDKAILAACVVLILSPIDFIPDWIPIIGVLDDLMILALILDYFFKILDAEVLLDHYPFSMKSFLWLKRISTWIANFAPEFIKKRIWSYVGRLY